MHERSRSRQQALQILYQGDITGQDAEAIIRSGSYSTEDGEPDEYCFSLVRGVASREAEIDQIIGDVSEHWTVHRMPVVDRNILRLATYEIVYLAEVPPSVSINEAVELAKIYGGEDSSKFVNGVLGRIAERNAPAGVKEASDG